MAARKKGVRKQVHANSSGGMKKEEMFEAANSDTPEGIQVNTWPALIVWAFGKFGLTIVFIYAAWLFYQDQRNDRRLLLEAYRESSAINEKSAKVISDMSKIIEEQSRVIEEHTDLIRELKTTN